jgi:preprotein translocase SecF subunit
MAVVSLALVVASLVSLMTAGFTRSPAEIAASAGPSFGEKAQAFFCTGFNCGVDFKGGTLIEVSTADAPDLSALRSFLLDRGLGDVQVQAFGAENSVLLRFESPDSGDPVQFIDGIKNDLAAAFQGLTVTRAEVVGPKVSSELFRDGLTALGLAILLMMVYIWTRFQLNYGVGAVIALMHDVILTMGMMSILRLEFSLTSIAALLTVIGYSMNDTVVVFDRMRENRRKYKKMLWPELMDLSMNETFSRTVITGGTGILALTSLWVFGGESLASFVIAMLFGIIVGTYSSLYVAAPVMLFWTKPPTGDDAADASAPVPAKS